jgi:hypothetical protein
MVSYRNKYFNGGNKHFNGGNKHFNGGNKHFNGGMRKTGTRIKRKIGKRKRTQKK